MKDPQMKKNEMIAWVIPSEKSDSYLSFKKERKDEMDSPFTWRSKVNDAICFSREFDANRFVLLVVPNFTTTGRPVRRIVRGAL